MNRYEGDLALAIFEEERYGLSIRSLRVGPPDYPGWPEILGLFLFVETPS